MHVIATTSGRFAWCFYFEMLVQSWSNLKWFFFCFTWKKKGDILLPEWSFFLRSFDGVVWRISGHSGELKKTVRLSVSIQSFKYCSDEIKTSESWRAAASATWKSGLWFLDSQLKKSSFKHSRLSFTNKDHLHLLIQSQLLSWTSNLNLN